MNKRSKLTVFLCLFLCVMMAVGCLPVQSAKADETADVWYGDVNDDGKIDAKDVTMLRRYLAGGWNVNVNEEDADINGDGEVNAKDVTMLRRYLAGGWGVELREKTSSNNVIYDTWEEYVEAGGTDEEIFFPDINLKNQITQFVLSSGKALKEEGKLWRSDVYELTWIGDIGDGITDITGLGELVNLRSLNIYSMEISDISELATLTGLQDLFVQNTQISDVEPLKNLKKLRYLDIHGSKNLKNIDALSELSNLKFLEISRCRQIKDVKPVYELSDLESLYMNDTEVSSLSGIENLKKLTTLSIEGTRINDISAIYGIAGLTYLGIDADSSILTDICERLPKLTSLEINAGGEEIDIEPLKKLMLLDRLSISNAIIENVNIIGELTGLTSISLCEGILEDISFVKNLTNLTYLNIWDNKVTDITPVSSLTKLTTFVADYNDITDVSPLKELRELEFLSLQNNDKLESVSILSGLINLWMLDLDSTSVTEEEEQLLRTALPNANICVSRATDDPIQGNPVIVDDDSWEQYIEDGGIDEIIEVKDDVLRQKIVNAVINSGKTLKEENVLWRSDVYGLKYLETDIDATVKDLTGLGELVNLRDLNIRGNYEIKDFSELSKLKNLNTLMLQHTGIEDISPIKELYNLKMLVLTGCTQITDFDVISYLDQLNTLDVHDCTQLTDITPFMGLTSLYGLHISGTGVTSLDGIDSLERLNSLSINNTAIKDIAPIYELSDRLISLGVDIDNNGTLKEICENLPLLQDINMNAKGKAIDLTPIKGLTKLTRLAFSDATLTNIAFIGELEGLTSLSLVNDGLEDISFVENLSELTYLNIIDNKVSDLTPMKSLGKLKTFVAYNNGITDIKPLEVLKELGFISLSFNRDLSSVSCLENLPELWMLELVQTSVPEEEIQKLRTKFPNASITYSKVK